MSSTKSLFLITLISISLAFIGCSSSADDEPTTIIEAISELDEAQIFASWTTDPDISEILTTNSSQIVIAPTDQAIQSLLSTLNITELPKEAIIDIVSAHIIRGNTSIADGETLQSINGVNIIRQDNKLNDASIIIFKTVLQEGAYLLIDKVLIPNRIRLPYNSTNFQQNTVNELEIGNNLLSLASYFNSLRPTATGEMSGTTKERVAAALAPLRTVSSTSFIDLVDELFIDQLVEAANGGDFHPDSSDTYNGMGGGFTRNGSARYFYYKDGTETQQIIEKGLYMATMYNQLYATLQNISSATPDKVIALVGATPAFSNSARAASSPDRLGANYFARRDKNESGVSGIYKALQYSISALNVAIAVNDSEAISRLKNEILLNYERGIIATVANYLHSTSASISKTAPTDNDLSAAMHAYSEALGFMMGFVDLPTFASEAQLSTIWNHMLQPDNSTGEFNVNLIATDRFASVQRNNNALDAIRVLYGFSTQEMEDFRFNWVNEQGR